MKIKVVSILTALALLIPACAEMNWENMTIKATSMAPTDAVELLRRELSNIKYDARISVGDFLNANFDRAYRLNSVLNEHRAVQQNYLTDGGIEYQYQLPLAPKILSLLLPDQTAPRLVVPMLCPCCGQEWPKEKPVPEGVKLIPRETETTEYTGIIIDCRGYSITPCLFPRIINDQNQEVYSVNFADVNALVDNGLVLYSTQDLFNHPRVGYNPLRITARGAAGVGSTDIMISSFDARRLHGSKQILSLLEECRVAIIIGP